MTEFIIANLAPIMFASLIIFLLIGYPVAFSLAANGIFFGLIGIQLGLLHPIQRRFCPQFRFATDGLVQVLPRPRGFR